jgi:nucleotide-binding universal stress UspA family protein
MNSKLLPRRAIVVGVDGSSSSDLALDWAVEEATRRRLPLRVVHAFSFGHPMTDNEAAIDGLSRPTDSIRENAVARARRANSELEITWNDPAYGPASSLISASEKANTVVLGARGITAAPGMHMGSVAVRVVAHARCPVVVIHDTANTSTEGANVVVGVDGSAASTQAIAYAFKQASSRGVGLTVVHAWWLEYVQGAAASTLWTVDWQHFALEEQALVAESLAGWQEKYPEVAVHRHNVRGLPVEALVLQSENASLVVVGTHGRGGFGSVSQSVMNRAHCPVAIIHGSTHPHDRDDPNERLVLIPLVSEHA